MHCKNVVIQSIEPPIALQKHEYENINIPFVAYKTLEIKPMVKILRKRVNLKLREWKMPCIFAEVILRISLKVKDYLEGTRGCIGGKVK